VGLRRLRPAASARSAQVRGLHQSARHASRHRSRRVSGPLGRAGDPPRIKLDLAPTKCSCCAGAAPGSPPLHRPSGRRHPRPQLLVRGSLRREDARTGRTPAPTRSVRRGAPLPPARPAARPRRRPQHAGTQMRVQGHCGAHLCRTDRPPRTAAIEVEWEQMLAHQLPTCPPFAEFWRELPEVFEWLNEPGGAACCCAGRSLRADAGHHLAPAADGSGLGRRGGIAGDDPLCCGQPPLRAAGLHQGQRRAHVARPSNPTRSAGPAPVTCCCSA
jgi:hypothetical protein